MTTDPASFPIVREAVASFPDRQHFHAAVSKLLTGGFAPGDLSVLASHDPLVTAGEPNDGVRELLPAGLSGEIKFMGPLTVAGLFCSRADRSRLRLRRSSAPVSAERR
jgi:hypothetical protein